MKMYSLLTLSFGGFVSAMTIGCGGDSTSSECGDDGADCVETCSCFSLPDVQGEISEGRCNCIDETYVDDYSSLETCQSQLACPDSFAQLIEGGESRNYVDPNLVCLLTALRDRTAGRYLHETDHTFTDGDEGNLHGLIVQNDGQVAYARSAIGSYGGATDGPQSSQTYFAAERCTLKPATYFEDCLVALGDEDEETLWSCLYSDDKMQSWFESCETETPTCE